MDMSVEKFDENSIIVKRQGFGGILISMTIHMSQEKFKEAFINWQSGTKIQNAFHGISAAEREFILSGTTPFKESEE